jgi:hypothetical protein
MSAVEELADELGTDTESLSFLLDADEADVRELLDAYRAARSAREQELRDAVDRALGVVPRPLRGRVRKLIGGRRG